jgi:hypothetical protein
MTLCVCVRLYFYKYNASTYAAMRYVLKPSTIDMNDIARPHMRLNYQDPTSFPPNRVQIIRDNEYGVVFPNLFCSRAPFGFER